MNTDKLIEELGVLPTKKDYAHLKTELDSILIQLEKSLKICKLDADIFIGGSYAKRTLVKKKVYDVDIFVRFDWRYEFLSEHLEKAVKDTSKKLKLKYEKIHGSRDYFIIKKGEILFEIIPVLRISKPKEAKNVTDLSYFHVNYVKKNMNDKIKNEIILLKTFCKAHGLYGAESYIRGFSGYAIECLVIHYKSFEKTLKEIVKSKERILLDPEKKFNSKQEILINMNSSKLGSPIVLIDPTWQERNVLAALSEETYAKFRKIASDFLKNPSKTFFDDKEFDLDKMKSDAKSSDEEFLHFTLTTNKQKGDIAGTKLKKFFNYLESEIESYFHIIKCEFFYDEGQEANAYLNLKSKKEIIKIGPPVNLTKAVSAFKKKSKNTFVKNGFYHKKIKIDFSAKKFCKDWIKKYSNKIKEMSITSIKIQ